MKTRTGGRQNTGSPQEKLSSGLTGNGHTEKRRNPSVEMLHLWEPVSPGFTKDDGEKVIDRYREISTDAFVFLLEENAGDAYGSIRVSDPE